MIGIHPVHRKLAIIAYMNSNVKGEIVLDKAAIKLLKPLLMENLQLIQQHDGYKEAAYMAQVNGHMDLVQHFCERLDEMEAEMI